MTSDLRPGLSPTEDARVRPVDVHDDLVEARSFACGVG